MSPPGFPTCGGNGPEQRGTDPVDHGSGELIGSLDDLAYNDDGSVDLFFGPEKPEGISEENFVLTKPGEGWFAYFRFYGPLEPYFDKTWAPNDFERISK